MLKWMIDGGYGDERTIQRRIAGMEAGAHTRPLFGST